ncbi:enoyl-CoA hydratase family protein [Streptomyces sp. NA04227]|uniref:enoyl-CoA hydratase family protein n=1 Tax=Streptomyces sp. NA04227 TaxID=2742136 RepID=UPI0015902109|nr:enoyl-CoA hydratase family protein [Streptomyces sp. NA04227]QKW10182.1 enoyl-CoA hydratase family protein [Streptomyces sp. NA04227]
MTTTPLVSRADKDGVTTLTLDSPHNRNALSARLVAELTDEVTRASQDLDVRAVLLTHTGTTFCAGIDLDEARHPDHAPAAGARRILQLLCTIVESPKPVVARVAGHARAGGIGLLGACDIVAAGPQASFAFTEVLLGLAPAVLATTVLPRLDPRAASRYLLTGERFDAAEAARIGLVTLAPEDGLDTALAPVLDGLRSAAPNALAATKRLTTAEVRRFFDRDADALTDLASRLLATDEAREGIASFLERRRPVWAS